MRNEQPAAKHRDLRWLWCVLVLVIGAAGMLLRVPTTLGVKVPETRIPGLDPSLIDTSSNEHIWRVWWRARDDYLTVHPQWLMSAGLLVLLALFVIALLAAIWFALSPGTEAVDRAGNESPRHPTQLVCRSSPLPYYCFGHGIDSISSSRSTVVGPDGRVERLPNALASVDHPFHAARFGMFLDALRHGHVPHWVFSHQGGYPAEFYPFGTA